MSSASVGTLSSDCASVPVRDLRGHERVTERTVELRADLDDPAARQHSTAPKLWPQTRPAHLPRAAGGGGPGVEDFGPGPRLPPAAEGDRHHGGALGPPWGGPGFRGPRPGRFPPQLDSRID